MNDLLSQEHYYYKIHTLLKSSAYLSPSTEDASILQENPEPLSFTFSKNSASLNAKTAGGGKGQFDPPVVF